MYLTVVSVWTSDADEPHVEGACAASPPRTPKGTCATKRVQWRQKGTYDVSMAYIAWKTKVSSNSWFFNILRIFVNTW